MNVKNDIAEDLVINGSKDLINDINIAKQGIISIAAAKKNYIERGIGDDTFSFRNNRMKSSRLKLEYMELEAELFGYETSYKIRLKKAEIVSLKVYSATFLGKSDDASLELFKKNVREIRKLEKSVLDLGGDFEFPF